MIMPRRASGLTAWIQKHIDPALAHESESSSTAIAYDRGSGLDIERYLRHLPQTPADAQQSQLRRGTCALGDIVECTPPHHSASERLRWAHKVKALIDVRNGYMEVSGDGAQQSMTVCLFRCPNGSYVVAIGDYDREVFEPYLDFYRYERRRLRKVTRGIFPVRYNPKWDYVLPRYGRTIHVMSALHRKVYDLAWRGGGRFYVVKPGRPSKS